MLIEQWGWQPLTLEEEQTYLHPQISQGPYRGLDAFTEADTAYFFGRETAVGDLQTAVRQQPLNVIIGPSGSGKTSLIHAGLIPQLRQDKTTNWIIVMMRPTSQPFQALAIGLMAVVMTQHNEVFRQIEAQKFIQQWQQSTMSLAEAIQNKLTLGTADRLLLIIDQFEELFTTCPDPALQARFLTSLSTLVIQPGAPFSMLLALRADFLEEAMSSPALAAKLGEFPAIMLPPMSQTELEAAILQPAYKLFTRFEEGLLARVLLDVGDAPGKLTLLEFALTQLWGQRKETPGWLTIDAYEAIGRVQGALNKHAEAVFNNLEPTEQEQMQRLFVQLVKPGEQGSATRLPATPLELSETQWQLAQKLATAETRLVVISNVVVSKGEAEAELPQSSHEHEIPTANEPKPKVELVHEALIEEWQRFKAWIDEAYDFRIWQEDVRTRIHQWQQSNQDEGILLRGSQLTAAEDWLTKRAAELSQREYDFIHISTREQRTRRERELEQARKLAESEKRRSYTFRIGAIGATLLTIIAIIFAISSNQNANIANVESTKAVANEVTAIANANIAATNEVIANLASTRASANEATAVAEANSRATAEAEAVLEANSRATAEAVAVAQAERAEQAAAVSRSRELAARSINQTDINAELALLLAIEAGHASDTFEAGEAIRQAITRPGRTAHIARGHESEVWHVAWHPDGSRYVTAGNDGMARIWDDATGQELLTLTGHLAPIWQAAWNPTGNRIVTASADGTARIWDAESGEMLIILLGHLGTVWQAEWDASGSRIVTASDDMTARVWDAATGRSITTLSGHISAVSFVAWDATGTRIATAGWTGDGTARVWDAESGEALAVFTGHTEPVAVGIRNVGWDPQGERLVTSGGDGIAYIWDATTGEALVRLAGSSFFGAPHDPIRYAAWSPRGTAVVTTSADNLAEVWNAETGERISVLSGHTDWVIHAAWQQEGTFVLTSSWDGTARVWNPLTGVEITRLTGHTGPLNYAAWSPTGEQIVTASSDGTARLWQFTYGVEGPIFQNAFTLLGSLHHVAWDGNGHRVVIVGEYGGAQVWDTKKGTSLVGFFEHDDWIYHAVWNKANTHILTTGNDNTARIWDAATGEEMVVFAGHSGPVLYAEWNEAETEVVTASGDGTARIWDAVTGAELHTLSAQTDRVNFATWNNEGTRVVTASDDGTARIWDATTGQEITMLSGHTASVNQTIWNSAGTRIATASDDDSVRVWDTATGVELLVISGHLDSVESIMWNQAGTQLLTASADDTARIWDSESGEQLLVFSGHTGSLTFAGWNQDETMIVTTSWDNTARVWNAMTGELKAILGGFADSRFAWVDHGAWDPTGTRLIIAASDGTTRLFYILIEELTEAACQQTVRNMSRQEWQLHMGGIPYRETCPGRFSPE